jgi:stage V sporulation protein D (sporulation-specific penicillin-binding protein)
VLFRVFYIQVIWGKDLQAKAIDQWTREIPIIATRGKILDKNGVVLADNKDTYTVFVRKSAVGDVQFVADALASVLEMSKDYVYNRLTTTISSEITIKKQVEKEKIDKILSLNLSGVYLSRDNTRIYSYNDMLSSVLGFTSNDGKGQSGLELYYDKYLTGENGEILYETDIVGVEIDNKNASYYPATNGLNIKLTIDYEVQKLCDNAMSKALEDTKAKSVSMLVVEPNTGAIVAMTNRPSLDLNNLPRDDLNALYSLTRNKLVCDAYEPGSTFKILTAAANIEEYLKGNNNAYSINHIYSSNRYRYVDGRKVKCWSNHSNGKHSNLTLSGALNNSCNPIFVDIALSLGKEKMYEYINKFNYGSVTGIDFKGEAQGMVLPINYVQNMDLARIAFGQTIACTPLQLAMATCSMINGGNYYAPYLVEEIYSNEGIVVQKKEIEIKNKTISQKASSILNEMLEKVVSEGSGKNAYIEGYNVAGKTGTAQKYENGVIAQGKYVSSFIGYFPANSPKYLALVIVDEPVGQYYGSIVASPYAKNVFQGIINLKKI